MKNLPEWYKKGKEHVWYPYTQMQSMHDPIIVESANGCSIKLADERILIDGVSSWWSACHGYNNKHIKTAVSQQLEKLPHIMFAGTAHEPAYHLAERLCRLTGMDRVFFTDSGSTSVETAMKMAVQYWRNVGEKRRNKFVCFEDGYHGDTMGCMSLCDPDKGMHQSLNDYMPKQYFVKLPTDEYEFAEFDALLCDLRKTIAGVIIEPLVQGAGGFKFHSPDILAEIYRICKKHELLFIADEIMTGFGRTGYMFACEEAAISPDIMCLGKALTGGTITLAATMAKDFIFKAFLGEGLDKAFMSGPTYMANPLACAAANASLDLFEDGERLRQVEQIEQWLYTKLQKFLTNPKVTDVRVKGAIGVIQINNITRAEILEMRQNFIKKGVLLRPFDDVIYIMPPFIITEKEIDIIVESIASVL